MVGRELFGELRAWLPIMGDYVGTVDKTMLILPVGSKRSSCYTPHRLDKGGDAG